jgi:hypothetical protein
VNRAVILSSGIQAIEGKINSFADAHACVTQQQKDIGSEIVAA